MKRQLMIMAACYWLSACDDKAPVTGAGSDNYIAESEAVSSAAADISQSIMPAAFHGTWDTDASACAGDSSDMRLNVTRDRLRFYESTGRIKSVAPWGENQIRVDADFEGEGDVWSRTLTMALSNQAATLTIDGVIRVRC